MAAPITYYYEFASPFGYLSSELIEPLAEKHGREIIWKPFLLGAVFKSEGTQPLTTYPKKGVYSKHDIERTARQYNIPFVWPPTFPFLSVAAGRAVYWAGLDDSSAPPCLTHTFYRACFADGRDISHTGAVVDIMVAEGYDADVVEDALKDPAIKQMMKDETEAALSNGVFGSPMFVVDGEAFWGVEKMHTLDLWLETGGW